MRLMILRLPWVLLMVLVLVAPAIAAGPAERDPEDVLGELVVEAGKAGPARLVLPVVAVESPLSETPLEARVREVIARDLELSGEFALVPDAHAPVRPADSAAPLDVDPWRGMGVDIVVRVQAQRVPVGQIMLRAQMVMLDQPDHPVLEQIEAGSLSAERITTHRLADGMIRVLTGYEGPFASRLSFVRTERGRRTVYVIDPDGHGLLPRSPDEHLAVAPAFDPQGTLYWAASVERGRYRLYRDNDPRPIDIDPPGSIYGLAFDGERSRVALSIATGDGIQVFTGNSDFTALEPVTTMMLAMHPAFSPKGSLAFAGTAKTLQRIYVGKSAVSLPGLSASAPVFCGHPDGVKLVYSVGVRERSDLIVSSPRGRDPVRLTRGQGRNSYPACSPDGRLIAFFSTRRTGEGPGLYVMRVDGRRARKISNMVGESLQWSGRLPRRSLATGTTRLPRPKIRSSEAPSQDEPAPTDELEPGPAPAVEPERP